MRMRFVTCLLLLALAVPIAGCAGGGTSCCGPCAAPACSPCPSPCAACPTPCSPCEPQSTVPDCYTGLIVRFRLANGSNTAVTAYWTVEGSTRPVKAEPKKVGTDQAIVKSVIASVSVSVGGRTCSAPVRWSGDVGNAACDHTCRCP